MKNVIFLLTAMIAFTLPKEAVSQVNIPVLGFERIVIDGPFNVVITVDGTESLKLDIDANMASDVKATVANQTLRLRLKKKLSPDYHIIKANVYITAKTLRYLENDGSENVNVKNGLTASSLKLVASSSGNINTAVQATDLGASITGSGSIFITGTAGIAHVRITGSGQFLGKALTAKNVFATITGSGNIFITASETVSGMVTGSGNTIFTGNATISDTYYTGSGRIVKK